MSERPPMPPDDDARLASAWREHSAELPPAHLDAAILAAARRETGSKPRAAGDDDALAEAREPSRWWWGLAAAATIGAIAFGVVQLAPPEPHGTPSVVSDVPPAALTKVAPAPEPIPIPRQSPIPQSAPIPQPFPRTRESAPLRRMEAAPAERAQAADSAAPIIAAPAPAAPPAAPAPPPAEPATAERREAPAALGAQLQRSDGFARKAAPASAAAPIPGATEFIDRIRRAYGEGRFEDAQRELAAFRAAFDDADERLPEPVKAWAAGIPRSAQ